MSAPTYTIAGHEITAPPLEPALYLVATPIGNLRDVTIRALETLAACDVLACEDTRITRRLLDRYGIAAKPVAYHEHNADQAGPRLLAALADGRSVALVSDAGTPLVLRSRLPARYRGKTGRPCGCPDPRSIGGSRRPFGPQACPPTIFGSSGFCRRKTRPAATGWLRFCTSSQP